MTVESKEDKDGPPSKIKTGEIVKRNSSLMVQ